MNISKRSAHDRFHTKIDWLDAWHHFSFGQHYDDTRVRFGALLVVNDDIINARSGFGTHPHRDMEIITIPLTGVLTHEDSTGGRGTIGLGSIQVMTAGTGVSHSEYNHGDVPVHSYQLWIIPEQRNLVPKYIDATYDNDADGFITIVSKDLPETIHIHQDAYISVGHLTTTQTTYSMPIYDKPSHGLFITMMEGSATFAVENSSHELMQGDSLEIDTLPKDMIVTTDTTGARVLVIQVPML